MRESLEQCLKAQIIGQDPVLEEITSLLDRALLGFRYPGEPIAKILSLGSTGIGKTASAIIACEHLFGPEATNLIRFDMSEYQSEDSLKKMLGDGQQKGIFEINYEETSHRGMILFDEIEKAATKILDVLLQVLSAARVTMASGRVLDLSKYVVFCTSNIGGRMLMESIRDAKRGDIIERAKAAALQELRPEILNRFDLVAVYDKLSEDCTDQITKLHVQMCVKIMDELGHKISVSKKCIDKIRSLGYSEAFGAREIRRQAMEVLGTVVMNKIKEQGEWTRVCGTVDFDIATGIYGITN